MMEDWGESNTVLSLIFYKPLLLITVQPLHKRPPKLKSLTKHTPSLSGAPITDNQTEGKVNSFTASPIECSPAPPKRAPLTSESQHGTQESVIVLNYLKHLKTTTWLVRDVFL